MYNCPEKRIWARSKENKERREMQEENKALKFNRPAVAAALELLCCALWGSAFPLIKLGYQMMEIEDSGSQILYGGVRFLLAGLMTLAFAALRCRGKFCVRAASVPAICAQGLLQTTAQYAFYYIGLAHCTSSRSAVINTSYTFFAIIIAHFVIKGERMDWRKTLGCLLGFGGIIVMNLGDGGLVGEVSLIGEGFILIGSIAYGASCVTIKILSRREDTTVLTAGQLIFGSLIMLLIAWLMGGKLSGFNLITTALLLYLAAASSVAFTLWSLLLKYNSMSRVTIFGFSIPVFGVAYSALLLNEEVFTVRNLAALLLVCAGIIAVNGGNSSTGKKAAGSE